MQAANREVVPSSEDGSDNIGNAEIPQAPTNKDNAVMQGVPTRTVPCPLPTASSSVDGSEYGDNLAPHSGEPEKKSH